MSSPQPGKSGIPYTHREVFLAAPYGVGRGLDTFGGIGNTALQNQDSISDVLDEDSARKAIRDSDDVFSELLKSNYLSAAHASELAALYIERNSPNIENVNSYADIDHLMNVENMSGWDQSDIQLFLGVKKAFTRFVNNPNDYMNEMLQRSPKWARYWKSLSTLGIDKFNVNSIVQAIKYEENRFTDTDDEFFSSSNTMESVLGINGNSLSHSPRNDELTYPDHPAVPAKTINPQVPTGSNYGSMNGDDKTSPYSTQIVGLLNAFPRLREFVAGYNLGFSQPTNFTFGKLLAGEYSKSFVEALASDLHDEIIATASTGRTSEAVPGSGDKVAQSSAWFDSDSFGVSGDADEHYDGVTIDVNAKIRLHPIDVTGYSIISMDVSIDSTASSRIEINGTKYNNTSTIAQNIENASQVDILLFGGGRAWNDRENYYAQSGSAEIRNMSLS